MAVPLRPVVPVAIEPIAAGAMVRTPATGVTVVGGQIAARVLSERGHGRIRHVG